MTSTRPIVLIIVTALSQGACGAGSSLLREHPELAPGATTWEALQRAEAGSDDARAGAARGRDVAFPATFRELVDLALERSPAVGAAWQAWRGQSARVGMAGALPDPRVTYTWLPLPVETRVGPNEHRVAAMQAIPSIPALVAQHGGATARARAAGHAYEAAVLEMLSELKSTVAEVRYFQRAVATVELNLGLATELAAAAAEGYGDDRGTLFDVNKARAQLAQLGYDRVRFDELLRAAVARLNAVLDRAPGAEVPALDPWPAGPVPPSVEPLYALALKREPRLRETDAQMESDMAAVREARAQFFPDLELGAQYMANGPARMPGVVDSGQDAVGLSIGLRVPLWFGKHVSGVRAAEADLARRVEQKRGQINGLLARIEEALYRLRNAARLEALYDESLLPEASRAMADAEAWYREGVGGYTDFLEARGTFYQFGLARERAAADRVQAEAALERLVGVSLAGMSAASGQGAP